jgi:hypothetical protein
MNKKTDFTHINNGDIYAIYMERKYTIELNYNAAIIVDVMAKDEGDALGKAREIAEEADMSQFTLTEEFESKVLNIT